MIISYSKVLRGSFTTGRISKVLRGEFTTTDSSNLLTDVFATPELPVAPVQTQQYPDRTSYNGTPVNLDLGDPYWTSNAGAMTYREVGLPGGLTMDVNTGIVTGTPNTNSIAQVDIYAANSEGETGPGEFQWSVIATPVVVPPEGAGLSLSLSLWV